MANIHISWHSFRIMSVWTLYKILFDPKRMFNRNISKNDNISIYNELLYLVIWNLNKTDSIYRLQSFGGHLLRCIVTLNLHIWNFKRRWHLWSIETWNEIITYLFCAHTHFMWIKSIFVKLDPHYHESELNWLATVNNYQIYATCSYCFLKGD